MGHWIRIWIYMYVYRRHYIMLSNFAETAVSRSFRVVFILSAWLNITLIVHAKQTNKQNKMYLVFIRKLRLCFKKKERFESKQNFA